jgi:hypothetical protein
LTAQVRILCFHCPSSPIHPKNPAHHLSAAANTIFGPFFGVPVTSFARHLFRKVTMSVRVYATPKTKCSLLATFCSRILLIWQSTSVIFRNSQLFWGDVTFQRSERLAVLNFHTLKTHGGPSLPNFRAPLLGPFSGSPSQVLCDPATERLPLQ